MQHRPEEVRHTSQARTLRWDDLLDSWSLDTGKQKQKQEKKKKRGSDAACYLKQNSETESKRESETGRAHRKQQVLDGMSRRAARSWPEAVVVEAVSTSDWRQPRCSPRTLQLEVMDQRVLIVAES